MLDPCFIEVQERLTPMILSALETQSFGLQIVSWQFVFIPQIPTPVGPRPGFGAYYQARGRLLGTENYLANLSGWTDSWITQEGVDEAIRHGCDNLREQLQQQSIIADGHGS
jgi:hypothetical protein